MRFYAAVSALFATEHSGCSAFTFTTTNDNVVSSLGSCKNHVVCDSHPMQLYHLRSISTKSMKLTSVDDETAMPTLQSATSTSDVVQRQTLNDNVTFQSPKFRVYIEDTDAYGVLYNSNYLRCYERALLHAPRDEYTEANTNNRSDDIIPTSSKWILSTITNQKFRSSPELGEEYRIRGELIDRDIDQETWELELVTQDSNIDDYAIIVHNSATISLTRSTSTPTMQHTATSNNNAKFDGKVYERRYIPYHDEFDSHHHATTGTTYQSHHIPLRNVMNFCERSRSDFLGGPKELRKMQIEDDLLWVVTGVEDGRLLLDEHLLERRDDGVRPGKDIIVQTNFIAKRRGMIIECQHRLLVEDGDSSTNGDDTQRRRVLAEATATIMALKGSTRRPTSKLPQWVVDKIM
eukprot:g1636.t1 g1636   contig10:2482516-2483733(-)